MPWPLFDILLALPVFALVIFRLAGLVLTAPIFGSSVIPMRVRAMLVAALAAIIFPLVRHQAPAEMTLTQAFVAGVGELMIGAAIGLALSMMLLAAEVGGLMVSRQAGIALAEVIDPTSDQQASVMGQLYTIVLSWVFLLAGGHRAAVAAVLDTYDTIPLLSFRFDETVILLFVEVLAGAFMVGIRLAAPVLIALFLLGTTLGFLSRTMPQLNILTIGFPLRAIIALAVAALAIGVAENLLLDWIWQGVTMARDAFGLDPAANHLVT